MNKALVILVIIQTALIGAFVFRFGALEAQTSRIEKAVADQMAARAATPVERAAPPEGGAISPVQYDALRIIVREEISRLAETIEASNTTAQAPAAPERKQQSAASQAAQGRLFEDFQNDLNTYRAKGVISPGEMAALEQQMARMSPAERARALSQLSKAMSDGSIKARL